MFSHCFLSAEMKYSKVKNEIFLCGATFISHFLRHKCRTTLRMSNMQIRELHKWNLTPKEAMELQVSLQGRLDIKSPIGIHNVKLIAGCDVAYYMKEDLCVASIVVCQIDSMKIVEKIKVEQKATFPYVPGLLSFREIPPLIKAVKKLKISPDIFVLDGQGIAHPRGIGLASHFGLIVNKPTIGCAKSKLIGEYNPMNNNKGSYSFLYVNNKKVGVVLRSRDNCKPIFISPGHKINIPSALNIIKRCLSKYRIPDVIRFAHILSNK